MRKYHQNSNMLCSAKFSVINVQTGNAWNAGMPEWCDDANVMKKMNYKMNEE